MGRSGMGSERCPAALVLTSTGMKAGNGAKAFPADSGLKLFYFSVRPECGGSRRDLTFRRTHCSFSIRRVYPSAFVCAISGFCRFSEDGNETSIKRSEMGGDFLFFVVFGFNHHSRSFCRPLIIGKTPVPSGAEQLKEEQGGGWACAVSPKTYATIIINFTSILAFLFPQIRLRPVHKEVIIKVSDAVKIFYCYFLFLLLNVPSSVVQSTQ